MESRKCDPPSVVMAQVKARMWRAGSQKALASRLGISPSALSNILHRGRYVPERLSRGMGHILDIEPLYLSSGYTKDVLFFRLKKPLLDIVKPSADESVLLDMLHRKMHGWRSVVSFFPGADGLDFKTAVGCVLRLAGVVIPEDLFYRSQEELKESDRLYGGSRRPRYTEYTHLFRQLLVKADSGYSEGYIEVTFFYEDMFDVCKLNDDELSL